MYGLVLYRVCCPFAGYNYQRDCWMQRLSALWRNLPQPVGRGRSLLAPRTANFVTKKHQCVPSRAFLIREAHTLSLAPDTHPISMSDAPEKFGNFDLIKRVKLDYTDVVISKWKSRVTGLSVVHLDYEGAVHLLAINHHPFLHDSSTNREWLLCSRHRKCAFSSSSALMHSPSPNSLR